MRTVPRTVLPLALFLFTGFSTVAPVVAQQSQQQDPKLEAARRADESWLALIDTGKYAESWKEASPAFQSAVPQEKWVAAISAVRMPLGTLGTRRLISANYSTTLPGVPDGEYEVLIFETSFEHKQLANETVISRLDKDGAWRVAGYYIK